jgi:hypothetical protein
MPCAKICLNTNIAHFVSRRENNTLVKYCGNTLIIPIVTLGTQVPFNPKGVVIANIIVFSNKFKKINKKKMSEIIQKFNKICSLDYICKNNKSELIDPLIDEIELFMQFINVKMNWEENNDIFNNIYFNKEKEWYNY